MMIFVTKNQLI